MYEKDPTLKQRMEEEERRIHSRSAEKKDVGTVYTIPVVVHIIFKTTAQNISDGLIQDQIARLNIDYRKLNNQGGTVSPFQTFEADTGIQFVLATTDPNGNPSNGITRTLTTYDSFPTSGQAGFDNNCQKSTLGGADGWDILRYMNVWVCELQGDKLGFAQLPGGLNTTDGIVIDTEAFGFQTSTPYNLGRTLTHETGHWFNLKHPWGDYENDCDEDDLVADTPQEYNASYECQLTRDSCNNLNMVQNFMDYSDDNCMTLFTAGQVARMRVELLTPLGRRSTNPIVNYNGTAPGTSNYTSPYGPLPGYTNSPSTNDPIGGGLSLDDFKHGTYLYIVIAVAGFIGLVILCACISCLCRSCRK